jgi:cell wall-associated NlpC family hydrolase
LLTAFEMRSIATFLLAAALSVVVVACGSANDPSAGSDPGSATTYGTPASAAGEGDVAEENLMSEGDVGDDGPIGDAIDADEPLVAADDSEAIPESTEILASATAVTTANLNLRKGPGTSYAVLAVIPKGSTVTLLSLTKKNAFYDVRWNGITGWSHSSYLRAGSAPAPAPVDVNGPPSPANAIARAKTSVGFSYWWGGGAWLASGATSSNKGRCSGSCPSCSHSGSYGADCSGMVGKAWQFGVKTLSVSSHPYSTASFVHDAAGKWRTVSRGALHAGDALVYNSGGGGHIVIWEKGDGWGSSTVYECKGCSYGCVHDTRTFSSAYHAIRRAGF